MYISGHDPKELKGSVLTTEIFFVTTMEVGTATEHIALEQKSH
jgi:hypothetical protein